MVVGQIGAIDFDVGVDEWIFNCFMELYMAIHGLGDGAINFIMEAFGIIEHQYHSVIEILSSLQLDKIIQDFSDTNDYNPQ